MNDYQLRLINNLRKYCTYTFNAGKYYSLRYSIAIRLLNLTRTDILLVLYNNIKNMTKQDLKHVKNICFYDFLSLFKMYFVTMTIKIFIIYIIYDLFIQ